MPGKPDSPQKCDPIEVDESQVVIQCMRGYDGGDKSMTYRVVKSSPGTTNQDARIVSMNPSASGLDILTVGDLSSGLNYTLMIFAVNAYGQSDDSFAVYVAMGGICKFFKQILCCFFLFHL